VRGVNYEPLGLSLVASLLDKLKYSRAIIAIRAAVEKAKRRARWGRISSELSGKRGVREFWGCER
jgi:hypothetical protein